MTASTPAELAESLAAETQVVGGKVHYLQKGAGAPLVLLHHSIGNHGWLPLYERLSEKFTVYVPDLPGFGESDRPDWARNVRDIAILIELWMDKLGLSATLAGFGFGGWVAAELSTMSQHRLPGLVLVGAAGIRPREGMIVDQMVVDYVDYVRSGFVDDAAFDKFFTEDPSRDTRMLLYGGREMTMRVTWKPWMFNDALPVLLRGVHTPTLVIWGSQDAIIPIDCGKQYAELMPNATLHIVDNGGHFIDFERPEELARLIQGLGTGG